jgi:hypothetical protein
LLTAPVIFKIRGWMKKPPKPSHDNALAAYHEAGHVVLAHFLQVRTCEVFISTEPDKLGRDGYTPYDARQMRGLDPTARAIIYLAGGEAQRKFNPRSWGRDQIEDDEKDATAAAHHLTRVADTDAFLSGLAECARSLLARPRVWRLVEVVATALLERRTLRGVEIDQIIKASHRKGIAEGVNRKTRR